MNALLMASLLFVIVAAAAAGLLAWKALRRVRGHFFNADGVQIHYTDEGNGEPVILVHGYSANSDLNWRLSGVIRRLLPHFRVIALDVRGHGLSGKTHDAKKYGIETVHDVRRLMDHLGIERAHVVGYSMGGFITYKFMTMYPDRLLSAMPCGAAWLTPGDPLATLGQRIHADLMGGPSVIPGKGPVVRWFERKLVGLVNDMVCLKHAADGFLELAIHEEELRSVCVPMMAIRATHEELVNGGGNLEGVLPGYQLTLIPKGLHSTVIFYPAFGETIKQFLLAQSAQRK